MLSRHGRTVRLRLSNVRALHATRAARERFDPAAVERAEDDVDVCIVGAGPAGLSAAIRLKQLEKEKGREVRVVVLEKGPEVGMCVGQCEVSIFIYLQGRISSLAPSSSLEL